MRRRETIAGLFVVVMLTLGAAIMLHWRAQQPRVDRSGDPNTIEWRPASPREYEAAVNTISGQLNAFRDDDFQKASMYESEMLRISFESVQNFRSIIMLRYPQFCSFSQVKYSNCVADPSGSVLKIQILLLSKHGTPTRALYFLRRENGLFRVSEVVADPEMFFGMRGSPPVPGSSRPGERPIAGHREIPY